MKHIIFSIALLLVLLAFAGCTDQKSIAGDHTSPDLQSLVDEINASIDDIDSLFGDFDDTTFFDFE